MDMVQISEEIYGQWGKCVRLSDGKNELFATLDFGPRIIKFSAIGKENMFFEDTDDKINFLDSKDITDNLFGDDKGVWHIRGGHRLWINPETDYTYYPDNNKVKYEKVENGIRLIPPVEITNDIQKVIEITMSEDNCVHVVHKITNVGTKETELAPWGLTVLSPGGTEIFPVPTPEETNLAYRSLVIWKYTYLDDKRVKWGKKYISLKQDENATTNFKVGQLSQQGWAAYFNHGDVFVKYFDTALDKVHPEGNTNFHTYTSKFMLEMESLGELKKLKPNETVVHKECWCYYCEVDIPDSECEIDKFVKEYIEE